VGTRLKVPRTGNLKPSAHVDDADDADEEAAAGPTSRASLTR